MQWLGEAWRRLVFFLRRAQFQRDLDEEMNEHLRMKEKDFQEDGMAPDEARQAARREFGNALLVRERSRGAWGLVWLDNLFQDFCFGFRQLRRNPNFAVVAVFTLALGVAANTTIFSAFSAILLRKPPVRDPDSLCAVSSTYPMKGEDLLSDSPLDFESWERRNNVFEAMAAAKSSSFTLTGRNEAKSVNGELVTQSYFRVIGLQPVLGRTFLPSEGQAGNDHVVILSSVLWHERFGDNPNIVGKNIEINNKPYTIVGVMPSKSAIPMPWAVPRLWTPLVFSAKDMRPSARGNLDLDVVLGRLKPGVTVRRAQSEMNSIALQLARSYPETNKGRSVTVLTLQEYLIRMPHTRKAMMMIMAVVGLVLLIACANIAGLLLARGAGRAHELAVRSAVGATRLRLVRQMLAESLLISVAGGGFGLLMSVEGIDLLRAGFDFNEIGKQMGAGIRLDGPTLIFTLAVTFLTTIMFGLVPALRASNASPRDALAEDGRAATGGLGGNRLRTVLVTSEVALALILLTGAGVMMRETIREFSEPLGFNPNHLLVAHAFLKSQPYQKPAAQTAFFRQVTEKLRNITGVESAGAGTCVFNGCSETTSFSIVGEPTVPNAKRPSADWFTVGPDYFRTMQIPLMKGREFSDSDNTNLPIVAVVNREFAHRFFPKDDAIGQQIEVDRGENKEAQIVGIVGNVEDYVGQVHQQPQIYESYLQIPSPAMWLVVRSHVALSALAPMLRRAVWSVDKNQPLGVIQTMRERIADNAGGDKLLVALMGIFAGMALILAAVGIYGMIAYSVTRRTREIGVRVALGARMGDVVMLMLRQGSFIVGIGCASGFAIALLLPRLFSAMFTDFPDQGPLVAVAVVFVVGIVSLLAIYIPSRRAAKIDPMIALRCE